MILDHLYTSHVAYGNMDVRIYRGLEWLRTTDLKALFQTVPQTVVIDGGRVKAQIQAYKTIDSQEGYFEAHRSYADIQVVVTGCEIIEWAPLARLTTIRTPYNFEKDLVYFEHPDAATPIVPLRMEEGDFCILFPTDGHKPRVRIAESVEVQKIVMKIAL